VTAKSHADVIVVGGGIVGCSIAYNLARSGRRDVVVLEKAGLTEGATWHAAGLIGQVRGTRNATRMIQRSVEIYDGLGDESGLYVDWKKTGSLRLASSPERLKEIKRLVTTARSFGVEVELIGAAEAQRLFPAMTTEGVEAAAYIPGDGYADPNSITQALARAARRDGASIHEGVRVEAINTTNRRVDEVVTDNGTYTCNVLVNAAGMWGRELGDLAGACVPACSVEHQYVITDPIPDLPREMPTMRDPDRLVYYKPEVGGLAIGGYEPDTVPFGEHGVPADFARTLLPGNLDRFGQLAEKAAEITPVVGDVGIREVINGPIPESADGDFVMGKAAGFDNFYVATGFLYGIAAAGGAGEAMAQWIIDGAPERDLWSLDVRRFHPIHNTRHVLFPRAVEHYASHYTLSYPGTETEVARKLRLSPLHHVLDAKGAVFGQKMGWERPNWFTDPAGPREERLAFEREATNWFPAVREEALAVRNAAGLLDQTSFAKLELWGEGALASMERLAVSKMDKPVGSVVYTQLCNARGGIEADLTITRLTENHFYIVTGAGFGEHDFDWIRANLPRDGSVETREVTDGYAVVNVCGPCARDVLSAVTDADVGGEAFPFAAARRIHIGGAPVLALRVGYTGELGWELHIANPYAEHVYKHLQDAGAPYGIRDVGYKAIDSLRLEKGYVYWSADVSPDTTPVEAGLGSRVALRTKGDYIGRSVLERQKTDGVDHKLAVFSIDGSAPLYGGEPIRIGGRAVGLTTSANYGFATGRTIAMGYLPVGELSADQVEIEAFTERYTAVRHDAPLHDPANTRVKA